MQSLDNKTLIHIGVETAVIGGVAFWFQKKTTALYEEIDELKKIIESQHQMLQAHEMILRNLTGVQQPPRHTPPQQGRRPVPNPPNSPKQTKKTDTKPLSPQKVEQPRVIEVEDTDDESDIEAEVYNDIIANELKQLGCEDGESCKI